MNDEGSTLLVGEREANEQLLAELRESGEPGGWRLVCRMGHGGWLDVEEYEQSDRGLKYYEPLKTDYGHALAVHESSAAEGPHFWLQVDVSDSVLDKDERDLSVHMDLEQLDSLIGRLLAVRANHYQLQGD